MVCVMNDSYSKTVVVYNSMESYRHYNRYTITTKTVSCVMQQRYNRHIHTAGIVIQFTANLHLCSTTYIVSFVTDTQYHSQVREYSLPENNQIFLILNRYTVLYIYSRLCFYYKLCRIEK